MHCAALRPLVSPGPEGREVIGADVPPIRAPRPSADVNQGEAGRPQPEHQGVVGPGVQGHAPPRVGASGRGRGHVIHAAVGPPVGQAAVVGHHGHEHVMLHPPWPGLRDDGGAPGGALTLLLAIALGETDRQLLEAGAGGPGPGRLTLTSPRHPDTIQ